MSKTERATIRFTVKEFDGGTPWIALEPLGPDLPQLKGGFLGLILPNGTTLASAQELAKHMNAHITHVSYTSLP